MDVLLNEASARSALVVEGGALRGVFSTGLLDGFLKAQFNPFDLYIGVSSGASNLAAYLAGMTGRNKRVYMDYSLRPPFIDLRRFFRGGHLLDLDWLWDITIREMRLDLERVYARGRPFIVVMTNVQTGEPVYKLTGMDNLEDVLKASSAMPVLYRGYPTVDGSPMTDGGVADALPVGEAIRRGARRIMVIRSRHQHYVKREGPFDRFLQWHIRHKPQLQKAIAGRVQRYNDSLQIIRRPPEGVRIAEVCPPEAFRVSRLSRNRSILQEGYEQGVNLAPQTIAQWQATESGNHG